MSQFERESEMNSPALNRLIRNMNADMSHAEPMPEEDRQVIILALARLALARPGWDHYLGEVSERLEGREMFNAFKASNADIVKPENLLHSASPYTRPIGDRSDEDL